MVADFISNIDHRVETEEEPMSIETDLADALKTAMRARDTERLACIRQVRAKIQETLNAPDFQGRVDDALYQRVIGAYVKTLRKGIEELSQTGSQGEALRRKYSAEVAFLEPYLPQVKSEAETRALVEQAIAETGISDPKQLGRVIGHVMKKHRESVDPARVRAAAEALLKETP